MTWLPHITVATIVEDNGRFLLVEEFKAGRHVFNQPAGHLEEGESLLEATAREALEEAAQHFVPEYLVGIYQWTRPQGDITYLRFAYGGRVDGEEVGRKLDDGIVRAVWMTIDEVRATADRHRSPLILQCIEDWLTGQRYPLAVVHHA